MIKEAIVVEGYHDELRIKNIYPEAFVITTNGSEISNETIELIKKTNEIRGVILFLDPDYPGRRITAIIKEKVPNIKVAYLKKELAISKNKKKVGVEHATDEDIINSLNDVVTFKENFVRMYSLSDLIDLGLSGPNTRDKRKNLCNKLGIPVCNAKTLLEILNNLNILRDELV